MYMNTHSMRRTPTTRTVERFSCTARLPRVTLGALEVAAALFVAVLLGAHAARAAAPTNSSTTINGTLLTGPTVKLGALPTFGSGLPNDVHEIETVQSDADGGADLEYAYLFINRNPLATAGQPGDPAGQVLASYDYVNGVFYLGDLSCVQTNGASCWTAVPPGGSLANDAGTAVLHGEGSYGRAGASAVGPNSMRIRWDVMLQNWRESAMTVWMGAIDLSGFTT